MLDLPVISLTTEYPYEKLIRARALTHVVQKHCAKVALDIIAEHVRVLIRMSMDDLCRYHINEDKETNFGTYTAQCGVIERVGIFDAFPATVNDACTENYSIKRQPTLEEAIAIIRTTDIGVLREISPNRHVVVKHASVTFSASLVLHRTDAGFDITTNAKLKTSTFYTSADNETCMYLKRDAFQYDKNLDLVSIQKLYRTADD